MGLRAKGKTWNYKTLRPLINLGSNVLGIRAHSQAIKPSRKVRLHQARSCRAWTVNSMEKLSTDNFLGIGRTHTHLNSKAPSNPVLKMGKEPDQTYCQRRHKKGTLYVHEKQPTSQAVRGIQIYSTDSHHSTPIRLGPVRDARGWAHSSARTARHRKAPGLDSQQRNKQTEHQLAGKTRYREGVGNGDTCWCREH